ncbi:MAG: DsbA family protein, partial [Hyphomicrobium sp.]|nr:DsbA family protein [Hyphomicrobium sp.]
MSLDARPSPWRVLFERKALWLAVPAIALLAGLAMIGSWSVRPPATVAQADPVAPTSPSAAAPASPAKSEAVATFSPEQKQELGKIIKEYLLTNPEVFLEAQSALESKMEKDQAEKLKVAIAENAGEIYRDPKADVGGNPNGDITVVEFFDYNCGYCKRGLHDVIKLVEGDPKVRVVFKELPILSKGSEEASRIAIAAGRQGKYWDMHKAMLEAKGQMNEANALAIATKLGLDIDKLKKDMASPEVEAEIKKSEALAKKMGVNGTPHFLVGDRAIPGAPEDLHDQLAKNVSELR